MCSEDKNEKDRIDRVRKAREEIKKIACSLEYILTHLSEYMEEYDLHEIGDLAHSYLVDAEEIASKNMDLVSGYILRIRRLTKAIGVACGSLYK